MQILAALLGFFVLSGAAPAQPTHATAPGAFVMPAYTVAMTGYNAVPAQTDNDPTVTASGAYSNPEIVAARSRDLAKELPFGTIIEITGPTGPNKTCGYGVVSSVIGYRVIADTMNARYTNRVDILFSTKSNYVLSSGKEKNAATVLGVCKNVGIRVVGHLDMTHPGRLPKTQEDLANLVAIGNEVALR